MTPPSPRRAAICCARIEQTLHRLRAHYIVSVWRTSRLMRDGARDHVARSRCGLDSGRRSRPAMRTAAASRSTAPIHSAAPASASRRRVHRRRAGVVGLALRSSLRTGSARQSTSPRRAEDSNFPAPGPARCETPGTPSVRAGHARLADCRWIQTEGTNGIATEIASAIAPCQQRVVEICPPARGFR